MKIKRYFAPDMRQAIRKVREAQGPDAVILSNRKVKGGVEIIAAIDYDPDNLPGEAAEAPRSEAPAAADRPVAEPAPEPAPGPRRKAPEVVWDEDPALVAMRSEIRELRGLLENQLAHLAWREFSREHPAQAGLLRRLTELGLPRDLCERLIEAVGEQPDAEQAWRRALALLAQSLPVTDDDILDKGGIVALIGSTGVGKTTTVAKLAARFALRHGPRSVALISTDSYRIGAHEQLFTYGRILGVPVQVAGDARELANALKSLPDKRLILIDTAGMSQRDLRLSSQFETLRAAGLPIRSYLVLPASTQTAVLEEAVRAFGEIELAGCILTKVDESASLGGALSVVARHRLPLAYVGDGQRVPEDLHPARAHNLVNRAATLMQQAGQTTDDDTLAERFGGLAAHARG